MNELLDRVRETGLLQAGRPVVVLLSGGRDSVCLLDVAAVIGAGVRALHVNYGLRDDGAAGLDEVVRTALAGRDAVARERLAELPRALARLVLVRLAEDAAGEGRYVPGAGAHLDDVLAAREGAAVAVEGGVELVIEGGVVSARRQGATPGERPAPATGALPVPGDARLGARTRRAAPPGP